MDADSHSRLTCSSVGWMFFLRHHTKSRAPHTAVCGHR
jgi:hypothetical protein